MRGWQRAAAMFCIFGVSSVCGAVAEASFHDWRITEVFSDPGGAVQFVEFREMFGATGENFLAGHVLSSTANSFTFPSNLPSPDTADKFFLVGTQSYASLAGVPAPDYVVPDGFFARGGDTLDFAGVDVFSFSALPTDGRTSISRTGSAINSPTNFAGVTGSIDGGPQPIPLPPAAWGGLLTCGVMFAIWGKRNVAAAAPRRA